MATQARQPHTSDDHALHARLLAGDPTAASDLAQAQLEPLAGWLKARFPTTDPHLLEDAAIELILSMAERPQQYDPARASLASYLRMAARGDVLNAIRSERHHQRRQAPLEDVELRQLAGKQSADEPTDPAEAVTRSDSLPSELAALVRSSFADAEWPIVERILEGERRTAVYARLLGLEDRPEIDQAREVKRVKDRLVKRLQRLAPKVRRDE